jgi:hypothetical protein
MLCPCSTDIVIHKIESGECLYWSIMADMQSIRRQVVLPCCCVVLEPDVVPLHHRYCYPQDREWWVSILINNGGYAVDQKKVILPCFCVVLEPDVVPLHHRYCCGKDWEWWVSILIDNGRYEVHQKTSCLTVLLCSAWARCCAPSSPILFQWRLSVVNVYMKI